jgi:hypothetical protein
VWLVGFVFSTLPPKGLKEKKQIDVRTFLPTIVCHFLQFSGFTFGNFGNFVYGVF